MQFSLMSCKDCQKSLFFFSFFFLQTETDAKDIFPYGNQTNGTVIAFFFSCRSVMHIVIISPWDVKSLWYMKPESESLLQLITICSSTNEVILCFVLNLRTEFHPYNKAVP